MPRLPKRKSGAFLSICVVLDQSQQHKVQNKQSGDHPDDGMDLIGLLLADLGDAVEDKAGSDAVGNAVAQSHEDAGEESGDCLSLIHI